jgi:ferredoxin
VKVTVEADYCVGHGMCNMYAPEVFHIDDEAKAYVDGPEVAPGLERAAALGASACPERAITVTKE